MTGPEHYRMAETLDAQAGEALDAARTARRAEPIDWTLARAQVLATRSNAHALMAQVHATADLFSLAGQRGADSDRAAAAWREVLA